MSNLAIPGQVQLKVDYVPAPFVTPIQFHIPLQNGAAQKVFGGLTKLELAACHLAGHCLHESDLQIVLRAQSILAACAAVELGSPNGEEAEPARDNAPDASSGVSPGGILVP